MAIKAQHQNEVKKVVTQADLDRKFEQVLKKLDEIAMKLNELRTSYFGNRAGLPPNSKEIKKEDR